MKLCDPSSAKLVQPIEDPALEALYDHTICALNLPVCAGVSYSGPINADVIFIIELEELLPSELRAIIHDNGVRYSKAMDDIKKE